MSTLPDRQIGVLRDESGAGHLQTFPIPEPAPGEVLIKNVAVASNPKDWKYPLWQKDYSYIEGNDVAGEIVKLGEGVSDLKVGERVAAFTKMATKQNKYGAYQLYSVSPAATVIPIPDDLGYEAASTLPLAIFTAAIGLSVKLGLKGIPDTPADKDTTERTEAVIVYGASSSVGAYVVQLAKLAGYFVLGVAGSSTEYAQSLGTDVVLDYRKHENNPTSLADAIVSELAGHQAVAAYDAIVSETSTLALAHAIVKSKGKGKITHVLPLKDDVKNSLPSGVEVVSTLVSSAHKDDEAFARHFARQLKAYLTATNGKPRALQPNRPKVLPNGLASVAEGLNLLQSDQVHGEKLVYRIADTPKSGGA